MPKPPTTSDQLPSFHFVFAVENKPAYINMARLLAYSIRYRAGALSNSRITVVFNDQDDDGKTADFFKQHNLDIACLTLPRIYRQFHYVNKYTTLHTPHLRESADWIVQLDADTAVINSLDDLAQTLADPNLDFAGVPVLDCPVWRLDRIIEKYSNAPLKKIQQSTHPWFPTKFPLFNGGVTFFRATHLNIFRDEILPLVEPIRNDMRIGGSPNPRRYLRNRWNRFIEKHHSFHPFIIPPYHSKNYADQIALPVFLFKYNLNYEILPHCYNWRSPDANQGENTPVRILHYLHANFPVNREDLFNQNSDWLREYQSSKNPGRSALAGLITDYNNWNQNTSPPLEPSPLRGKKAG